MGGRYYKEAMNTLHTGEGTPAGKLKPTDGLQKDWANRAKRIERDRPFER